MFATMAVYSQKGPIELIPKGDDVFGELATQGQITWGFNFLAVYTPAEGEGEIDHIQWTIPIVVNGELAGIAMNDTDLSKVISIRYVGEVFVDIRVYHTSGESKHFIIYFDVPPPPIQ